MGESLPYTAGSDVTRSLCTALYTRPAKVGDPTPWAEARLLRLVRDALPDPEALRDETAVLAGALDTPESEGFGPTLRVAARALPALVAGTVVQETGDAVVAAIRQLLG
ncbi:hypothetical protein [Streptomyces sp. NPDC006997]|uniref:hypothetical protein n=1 Tax=Streptomyces sp. NPDC006997 TaxID=3155356 RepID=UPI0033C54F63